MNNVFNLKRFGQYFLYDLNNARSNFGLSALVIGLLPLIMLVFNVIFGLVFGQEIVEAALPAKVVLIFFAFLFCILAAPVKLYGRLTERRSGSDWLMVPASSFEKFLSMALMLCIVVPVVVFGLFSICDLLLSWIVPAAYGQSISGKILSAIGQINDMSDVFASNGSFVFAPTTPGSQLAIALMGWCGAILPFGLGAVCFKKGKAAKTILCIIAVQIILSIILVLLVKGGINSGYDYGARIEQWFSDMTEKKAQFLVNLFINLANLIVNGGLLVALFFRVKTIKQ